MKKASVYARQIVAGVCLSLPLAVSAYGLEKSDLQQIELTTKKASIRVGEPFVFKLRYVYGSPRLLEESGTVVDYVTHGAIAQIRDSDGNVKVEKLRIPSIPLQRQDEDGLVFSGHFVLFYNLDERELVFDEPGAYTIALWGQEILGGKARYNRKLWMDG